MKNVEDIYRLSPMQKFMLLPSISARSDDVLFNQFPFEIRGALNVPRFEQSWRTLVDRHTILRSAFLWENLKEPVQVVRRQVDLPFRFEDWRDRSQEEVARDLKSFLKEDRTSGFDPREAPLMRVALLSTEDEFHYLVWSSHHLLLDRWCLSALFEELGEIYAGRSAPDAVATRPQFREYIRWIEQQDTTEAETYWQRVLGGLDRTTHFVRPSDASARCEEITLPSAAVERLRVFARTAGVTMSIVIQGAWSLVINQLVGKQSVNFGVVTAGRPPELPGVESIIGSFVNNVPVQVRLPGDEALRSWLSALQATQQKRSAFEYLSPVEIQRCSTLRPGESLFDTLLVWLASVQPPSLESVKVVPVDGQLVTGYPLTIAVAESRDRFLIQATLREKRTLPKPLADILELFAEVINTLSAAPVDTLLGDLPGFRGTLGSTDLEVTAGDATVFNPDLGLEQTVATQSGREEVDRDMLETLLRSEWKFVLGVDDLDVNDDFFDLGGTSLQAAQLHDRIRSVTRKSVPLLSLFLEPTIRGMAGVLLEGDWPLQSGLIIGLRSRGKNPPLFCIASPEVNTIGYAILSRYLDEEQPVYVIQAPPNHSIVQSMLPSEIYGMAVSYVEAMRAVQPRGPYRLLGMCGGAQLTFDMSRHLKALGEDTAFSGIINTWALYTITRRYHLQRVFNRFRWYRGRLHDLVQRSPREQLATIWTVLARRLSAAIRGLKPGTQSYSQPVTQIGPSHPANEPTADADGVDHGTGFDPWIEEVGWVHKSPVTEKHSGELTVYRIGPQQFWRTGDIDLGWGRHAALVDVEHLDGDDHDAILREPNVIEIAERISSRLDTLNAKETRQDQ